MDFDEDELARAVKAKRADVDAAMRAEDLDAYLSYYMEDAVWLPPGAEEYGKAAARQKLTSFFRSVNLEGVIDNQGHKDMANMKARGVSGVFSVTNNLQVLNPQEKK